MAKRYIDTKFWDDTYVSNLNPSEKLMFLYLLTNPLVTETGEYEISLKRILLDTGLGEETILMTLAKFGKDGKTQYDKGWIKIMNFAKHQVVDIVVRQKAGLIEAKPDFINQLITVFQEAYLEGRGYEYAVVNAGQERAAIGKLLKLYKSKNKESTSEQTIKDFRNLFGALCKHTYKSEYLNGITIPMIANNLMKYIPEIKRQEKKYGSIFG